MWDQIAANGSLQSFKTQVESMKRKKKLKKIIATANMKRFRENFEIYVERQDKRGFRKIARKLENNIVPEINAENN